MTMQSFTELVGTAGSHAKSEYLETAFFTCEDLSATFGLSPVPSLQRCGWRWSRPLTRRPGKAAPPSAPAPRPARWACRPGKRAQTARKRTTDVRMPFLPARLARRCPRPAQAGCADAVSTSRWSFSFSIIPSKEIPGLISFTMDWLDAELELRRSGSSLGPSQ